MQTMKARRRRRLVLLTGLAMIVIALLAGAYILSQEDGNAGEETSVTLFLSYVPSVQFAPAYVAAERGYFADEGITISFEHGNEADGLERIATGDLRFGLISGEQVVLARANNRPVVYIFEWYHRFPVGIVAPADANIEAPTALEGRVVGIPGPYGARYMGLRALLDAANLSESDLDELRSIGFAAPDSVCAGEVEAAVVYIVNEPLTIERQCTPVTVIEVSDYANLVSNGLVTNEAMIGEQPNLVQGMVRAIRRGLADVLADPEAAFNISVQNYVTDLPDAQYDIQREVLMNSLELWRSDDLGRTNPASWQETQAVLLAADLLDEPLADITAAYDMSFVEQDSDDR